MEVVVGTCGTAVDLLLRALRVCQYHRARDGHVHTVSNRHTGGWSAPVSGCAFFSLLFKSRRVVNALRYDSGSNLLWCRLRDPTNVVVNWPGRVVSHHHDLDSHWLRLVEGVKALVRSD